MQMDCALFFAAEDNKCRSEKMDGNVKDYSADCNGAEAKYLWTQLSNGR